MDFGSNIFGVGPLADPRALADVARLAEDLGYHSPVFSFDAAKVRQRLEQVARDVIEPYRRG